MESIIKRTKQIYNKYYSLNLNRFVSDKQIQEEKTKKFVAYIIIVCSSLINLIIGYIIKNQSLIYLSLSLLIGFSICLLLTKIIKKSIIIDAISALVYCGITTYFIISSTEYNYVILWILVAPMIIFSIMSIYVALISNTYVLLFVCVMFYSPLNSKLLSFYPTSFINYFPVVYFVNFAISYYIFLMNDINAKQSKINTYIDELTSLGNRSYYNHVVKYMQEQGLTNQKTIVVSLDVNGLKDVNDELGHSYGDSLLKAAANAINDSFKKAELIARIGGDEFVVITNESDEEFEKSLKSLDDNCNNYSNEKINELSISKGYAKTKDHPYVNPEKLYKIADEMMYKDKTQYYINNKIDRRKKVEDN